MQKNLACICFLSSNGPINTRECQHITMVEIIHFADLYEYCMTSSPWLVFKLFTQAYQSDLDLINAFLYVSTFSCTFLYYDLSLMCLRSISWCFNKAIFRPLPTIQALREGTEHHFTKHVHRVKQRTGIQLEAQVAIGLPSILSLFCNEFDKFNNTGARMLNSIYHMTLRLL